MPTAFSTKLESSPLWMTYQFLTQDLCGLEVVWLHGFTITAAFGEKKVCTTKLKNNNQQRSLLHYDLKEPFSKQYNSILVPKLRKILFVTFQTTLPRRHVRIFSNKGLLKALSISGKPIKGSWHVTASYKHVVVIHPRYQRPQTFWSAPRIANSARGACQRSQFLVPGARFLKAPETFQARRAIAKISNLTTTELFYLHILNMKRFSSYKNS